MKTTDVDVESKFTKVRPEHTTHHYVYTDNDRDAHATVFYAPTIGWGFIAFCEGQSVGNGWHDNWTSTDAMRRALDLLDPNIK